MPPLTLAHPPACPDCGAAIAAAVEPGVPAAGASGATLVDVRSANPHARYRVRAIGRAVATFPARCGCGAMFALTDQPPGLTLEVREAVECDGGWPPDGRRA
jgi:hypothetical protein